MEINKLIPCDFSRTQQAKCTLAIVSDVQRRITVAASTVAARQSQLPAAAAACQCQHSAGSVHRAGCRWRMHYVDQFSTPASQAQCVVAARTTDTTST